MCNIHKYFCTYGREIDTQSYIHKYNSSAVLNPLLQAAVCALSQWMCFTSRTHHPGTPE